MFHRFWIIFPLLTLFFLSCNKQEEVRPGFDMLYQQQFFIPVGLNDFQVHHFQFTNIPTHYEQSLSQSGKTDEDITGVITVKAALTGIYGDVNFDYVDQISLRVFDQSNPNDYLEIAYRYPVPLDPGNSIALIPSLADARRFFTQSRISFDVVVSLRKITTEESEVKLDLDMKATF